MRATSLCLSVSYWMLVDEVSCVCCVVTGLKAVFMCLQFIWGVLARNLQWISSGFHTGHMRVQVVFGSFSVCVCVCVCVFVFVRVCVSV